MQTPIDLDPQKQVRHPTLIFAITGWFIKNGSWLWNNFTLFTYQVKFNYSLRTSSYTC